MYKKYSNDDPLKSRYVRDLVTGIEKTVIDVLSELKVAWDSAAKAVTSMNDLHQLSGHIRGVTHPLTIREFH